VIESFAAATGTASQIGRHVFGIRTRLPVRDIKVDYLVGVTQGR
jgi:hypothetical protein